MKTEFNILDTKTQATYEDHTGTYNVILTDKIEETDDGLVVTVKKVKNFTYKEDFVNQDLKIGYVFELNKYTSAWGGKLKNVTVTYLEYGTTADGYNYYNITDPSTGDWYYLFEEDDDKWVLYHDFDGDSPQAGSVDYVSSSMKLLIDDSTKITKMAYFDQTEESKVSDIRSLFKKNVDALRCRLRASHGVITWVEVQFPL